MFMSGSYGLCLTFIYALYATFILHLDFELKILVYQIITGYALYAVTSLYMKQLQLAYNCVFLYYILSEIHIRTVRGLHSSLRPSNKKLRYARVFMTHNIRSKQPITGPALVILLYLCLPFCIVGQKFIYAPYACFICPWHLLQLSSFI